MSNNNKNQEIKETKKDIKFANTNDWISLANKTHFGAYDYSLIPSDANLDDNVDIICSEKNKNGKRHGVFSMLPSDHINEKGCPKCDICPSCNLVKSFDLEVCKYCVPLEENKLYKKTKEMKIVNILKNKIHDYVLIHNNSPKRPLYFCQHHIIQLF